MGFGKGVIASLKYTRGLLKKRSAFFENKKFNLTNVNWSKPKRKLSDFRQEIAEGRKKREILWILFGVFIFSSLLFFFVSNTASPEISFSNFSNYKPREGQPKNTKTKLTAINLTNFFNSGYSNLRNKKYAAAQLDFHSILTTEKFNYFGNLGMCRALVGRCILENYECDLAKEYILFTKLLKDSDLIILNSLLDSVMVR